MPTGVAVVCDTDDCLAVYLAVETGTDDDERSAGDVSQLARKAAEGVGWVISFGFGQPVMTCPGCADGRGPVRERGTCGGAWAALMRHPGARTACTPNRQTPMADSLRYPWRRRRDIVGQRDAIAPGPGEGTDPPGPASPPLLSSACSLTTVGSCFD